MNSVRIKTIKFEDKKKKSKVKKLLFTVNFNCLKT